MLLKNEKISPKLLSKPKTISESNDFIDQKYIDGEVRIVTEQARYPLPSIVSMLDSGNYELQPEFQRRRRWPMDKKSRLIESLIMNVPIPPIFLYEDRYSHYEVMDGLQRLTTIYDYYKNGFKLEGLEEWPELNGRRYRELPQQVRRGVDRRYLSSIILLQETAKTPQEAQRLKQLVFERINSGGVHLEPQETRNALHDGPLNQLCIDLARNKYLCKLWDIPEPTENEIQNDIPSEELLRTETYQKMDDVELVLRFFAYRQILDYDEKYSLREYLDHFLRQGNNFDEELLGKYRALYTRTMSLVYRLFGPGAFWLYRKRNGKTVNWFWLKRPTKVLYDPITFVVSQNLEHQDALLSNAHQLRAALPEFYMENYQKFEGRSTNKSNIVERNELFEELIARFR